MIPLFISSSSFRSYVLVRSSKKIKKNQPFPSIAKNSGAQFSRAESLAQRIHDPCLSTCEYDGKIL